MGYDTRLLIGPRTGGAELRRIMPAWATATRETAAYDDFVDRRNGRALAVGHGEKTTLVLDPFRCVSPESLQRWADRAANDARALALDFCELTDDYGFELRVSGEPPLSVAWKNRVLVSSRRARLPGRLRLPRTGSVRALWAVAETLGFDENPLAWKFTVWAPSRRGRAPESRRPVGPSLAFGPPFLRVLFVSGRDPKRFLTKLSRYAKLEYLEQLDVATVLGNCMSASQIAVGGCREYTVLFDESGSLAFDLRWLGPEAPSRALAVWGHVEAPGAPSHARFEALAGRAVFGFALHSQGRLVRRVTWVDGYESSSANGLPPSFLEAWGKALPIEKQLTRAKMGARFEDLERLAGALGFDAAQVLGVKLALFRVTART